MPFEAWITLTTLVAMFALLVATRLPAVVVFVGGLTATLTFQLAPAKEILSGFSNSAMLTIGALYMVAAGMYSTGAISLLADKFIGLPEDVSSAKLKILPPVAFGSAFLNNTPIVAMLIPIVRDICRIRQLSIKQLLIPLSFASILGGACTLIGTSSNLMMAGMMKDLMETQQPNLPPMRELTMFDPALVGVPALLLGLGFLYFFGKWLLPKDSLEAKTKSLKSYCAEFVVDSKGRLDGIKLLDAGLEKSRGFQLMAIERKTSRNPKIGPGTILKGGDVLRFASTTSMISFLWQTIGLTPLHSVRTMNTARHEHHLVEVVLAPKARIIGRTLQDFPIPDSPYRIWLVAVSRTGQMLKGPLESITFQAGDKGVLEVDESFFYENRNEEEFALVKRTRGAAIHNIAKAATASLITILMVTIVTLGWMTMLNAALLATGGMMASGCLTVKRAARSIDFQTLIIIACAIGFKSSLTYSGLADVLAHGMQAIGGHNPYVALTVVFLGAALMANFIAVTASVAFMFPIGLAIAASLDVSFMPFAITIMMGGISSFVTPTGYQTNLMVYEPGGYQYTDFVKIGLPMVVIVGVTTVFLSPLMFGFS